MYVACCSSSLDFCCAGVRDIEGEAPRLKVEAELGDVPDPAADEVEVGLSREMRETAAALKRLRAAAASVGSSSPPEVEVVGAIMSLLLRV